MECTQEHRAYDRSSGQTDWECQICGLNRNVRERNKGVARRNQLTVIASARHKVPRTGFVTPELVHGLGQGSLGLAELDHARLEVV